MQLTVVFCYVLLSITLSSVCAQREQNNDLQNIKSDRKLRRRETTVFIDSLPTEKVHHKPKVIYRRISKHRYVHPKPQYGPPRSIYGPKSTRRPVKKYNTKIGSKYPVHKKTNHKPRFRISPPKRMAKPIYGPPIKKKKPHRSIYNPSSSFAEPPKFENSNGFEQAVEFDSFLKPTLSSGQSTNHGYGEPPVDSYGAPIEPNLHDLASPTAQTYTPIAEESQNSFDIWRNHHVHFIQNQKPISKKPIYSNKPAEFDQEVYVTPAPADDKEEQNFNSYSDIYNYRLNKEKKKTKPSYLNHVKIMSKPWKGYKFSSKIEDSYHDNNNDDEIIVGGQYAEPPARHITKHQAPLQAYQDDEFEDPDIVSSATNSPYINYKNSNVAFSPQNLNDAFSIVD